MSEIVPENYKGWKVWPMSNKSLRLFVAPQLGGRVLQIIFDRYPFLFTNPNLEGQIPDINISGNDSPWLNFGGEKIWPAPQGWGSDNLWPGPPDPVLDGGMYDITKVGPKAMGIELKSAVDPYTGIQVIRKIRMDEVSPRIWFTASFTNKSNSIKEWSIWPVFQLDTPDLSIPGRYMVSCRKNHASKWSRGYKVMHGLVNNPQFETDGQENLLVNFSYLAGKVGLDCCGNWVAFNDTVEGKVFVLTFSFDKEAVYPESTSVQIWTQGRGSIYSRGKIIDFPNDPKKNPPYLELELLSPLTRIDPDASIHFAYEVQICTLPSGCHVIDKNEFGVIAKKLSVITRDHKILLTGFYGFFKTGKVTLRFEDSHGRQLHAHQRHSWQVDPLYGLEICFELSKEKFSLHKGLQCILLFEEDDPQDFFEFERTELWFA